MGPPEHPDADQHDGDGKQRQPHRERLTTALDQPRKHNDRSDYRDRCHEDVLKQVRIGQNEIVGEEAEPVAPKEDEKPGVDRDPSVSEQHTVENNETEC
ncbi:hypothetical protein [Halalkalicoccus salilacus]|uniref:hypothetical protein n=1 Tax=Halalkalicoccus TaxID=332246 RepID=UPI002F96E907